MSLWYKRIDEITFDDVDAFCKQGHSEGVRLDYKVDVPGDLAKLASAFANTLGGLVILGVEADKATNQPIWPPMKGMPVKPGIEEQIVAICRDNIYPPVRPQTSPLLENRALPGHVLVVIRVDESPEAPHAINNGRRIYERTGSQNSPCDLADVDRIRHLLERRQQVEERRAAYIQDDIKRATRQLAESRLALGDLACMPSKGNPLEGPAGLPLRWASVIPFYPWRDLCSAEECWQRLKHWRHAGDRQRVPGGGFAFARQGVSTRSGMRNLLMGCSSLNSKGHFFSIECTMETLQYYESEQELQKSVPKDHWLAYENCWAFARDVFAFSRSFYQLPGVELPGLLLLSFGILDALELRMSGPPNVSGKPFVDDHFGADVTVTMQEFLDAPERAASPLLERLAFGFDLPRIRTA